jgi:hypothetical protein
MPKNFAHLGGLNAYEILGIEPTATTDEIEAAYRAAIKRQHSDTGGVTRLAQLVNDARDALLTDRASYDAWLQARPRVTGAEPDPGSAASASDSSHSASAGTDDVPDDDAWDPWETVRPPPPPPKQSGPRNPPSPAPDMGEDTPSFSALRSWLGIRSARRASAGAVAAIVIGGMSVLYLVTLAIAIPLGMFSKPPSASPTANPTVMKQGQVVVTPGTKVVLDDEGSSFAPRDAHASLVGTEAGLLLAPDASYVALDQHAPERYDTCSALNYPEPTDQPIAWNRLTIGSMLCVRATHVETTKSLITVVNRSGRSATLEIVTWND